MYNLHILNSQVTVNILFEVFSSKTSERAYFMLKKNNTVTSYEMTSAGVGCHQIRTI